ncbi:hypothetical protein ACFFWC_23985 [Plantactinospora siamensis]|uniref:META domain-containing protein n=1 Tax=Plantactinospora siamensis TaxID=555372 RepID=A0ABV6P541_9ACTN
MSRTRWAVALMVAALLLAGCAEPGSRPPAPTDEQPGGERTGAAAPAGDPTALIGLWTVSGAAVGPGQLLRLAPTDLSLFTSCGIRGGGWGADSDGLFVAAAGSFLIPDPAVRCREPVPGTPAWLAGAARFRIDADGPRLLDGQGRVVARLAPGARPRPNPNVDPAELRPPTVTADARRALAPAAPVPANLVPAERDRLLGRWVPASGGPGRAYLELAADGGWRGSDGCNGEAGRWRSGPDGALLAIGGPETMIGCRNVPMPGWLTAARRAALAGPELVLLDGQARELGRLRRAG